MKKTGDILTALPLISGRLILPFSREGGSPSARRKGVFFALGFFSFAFSLSFGALSIQAHTDRNQMAANESLTLTLEISGDRDLPGVNLPALNDFDTVGSSRMSRVSIINGQVSKTLEMNYTLIPKRTGKLIIPALNFVYEGKRMGTEVIAVNVTGASSKQGPGRESTSQPAQAMSGLFLESVTAKKSYYVGEPILYTLRLYNRLPLFGQPSIQEGANKNITKMSQDPIRNSYQKVVQGMNYGIDEMMMAYLPMSSGEAAFTPVSIIYSFSPFEPNHESKSNEIKLNIIAVPNHPGYNQAIGNFSVESKVDRQSVYANDGFYLKLTVSGIGNLKLATAPDIRLPKDVDVFDPKVTLTEKLSSDGLKSEKTFEYLIIPRSPGKVILPTLTWTYFDPNMQKFIDRAIPGRDISVLKGIGKSTMSVGQSTPMQAEVEQESEDIHYIKSSIGPMYTVGKQKLKLLIIALNVIVWIGLFFFRPLTDFLAASLINNPEKRFETRLRKAGQMSDTFYAEINDGLLHYFAAKKKVKVTELDGKKLEALLSSHHMSKELLDDLHYFESKKYAPAHQAITPEQIESDIAKAKRLYKELRHV